MPSTSGTSVMLIDEQAIRAVLDRQTTAWNAGDAQRFLDTLTDDASFTHILGERHFGKHPLLEQIGELLKTAFRGSTLQFNLRHLTFIKPDIAVADIDTELRGYQALPPGVAGTDGALRTALLQVMVREAEQWRVVAFHNVDRKMLPGVIGRESGTPKAIGSTRP